MYDLLEIFCFGGTGFCAPEAEVSGSNPDGCAINVKTATSAVFAFIAFNRMRACRSTKRQDRRFGRWAATPAGRGTGCTKSIPMVIPYKSIAYRCIKLFFMRGDVIVTYPSKRSSKNCIFWPLSNLTKNSTLKCDQLNLSLDLRWKNRLNHYLFQQNLITRCNLRSPQRSKLFHLKLQAFYYLQQW